MTPQELDKAHSADLRASLAALRRAAQQARELAVQTHTAIVIVKNGKVVRIPAEELQQPTHDEPTA
jgi:hypothetical protein